MHMYNIFLNIYESHSLITYDVYFYFIRIKIYCKITCVNTLYSVKFTFSTCPAKRKEKKKKGKKKNYYFLQIINYGSINW